MKTFQTLILLLISSFSFAQKLNHVSLVVSLQPELTFSHPPSGQMDQLGSQTVPGGGVYVGIQYNTMARVFMRAGAAYTSRKVFAYEPLELTRLPEPYYDTITPPNILRAIQYRLLSFPFGLGYEFLNIKKTTVFAHAIISPNYLFSVNYNNLYTGKHWFKKDYLLGVSFSIGAGADYSLTSHVKLSGSFDYSITNSVKKDYYLNDVAVKHSILQLSLGAKLRL